MTEAHLPRVNRVTQAFAWRSVPAEIGDALDQLRYDRLRAHIPQLYLALMCIVTTAALAVEAQVPMIARFGIPLILMAACIVRLTVWMRRRHIAVDAVTARQRIRATAIISFILCACCTAWAMTGWFSTASTDRTYFPLFMAMGSLSVAYCLSNIPAAAFGNLAIGLLPSALALLWSGERMDLGAGTSMLIACTFLVQMIVQQQRQLIDILLLQNQMRALASTDSLTGIANRRALYDRLAEAISQSDGERRVAVALIDLDGFKPINDAHGHATGDQLLRQVAQRLAASCGEDALVARLGGDEFALLVPAMAQLSVQRHVDAALAAIARPFAVGTRQVLIGASAGIATWPDDGTSVDELIAAADRALYRAKAMRQAVPPVDANAPVAIKPGKANAA